MGLPLIYAIRQGKVEEMRWLLGHRVDPRVEGRGGATALRMSQQTGMDEVVRLVKDALGERHAEF